MLELTRVRRNRETVRKPVLRDLPPLLLVGVELHQACGLLANTGGMLWRCRMAASTAAPIVISASDD